MNKTLEEQIQSFIQQGLNEDVGDGDHTSLACIDSNQISRARLLVKDDCILAGMTLAEKIFKYLDDSCEIKFSLHDGMLAKKGDVAFTLQCNTRALLMGERLMLNSAQRMSGIATMSHEFAQAVKAHDTVVLDTRKTTPLIRFLEKWAVRIGGCTNYRDGLYDRYMIKDNHVEAAGSVGKAIQSIHQYAKDTGKDLPITVEVRNEEEMKQAMEVGGFQRIMLDNYTPDECKVAVGIVDGRFETEASGGITLDSVVSYAQSGVDFVSSGALTHSVIAKDLSLKIFERVL